jgi:hypothetical protein
MKRNARKRIVRRSPPAPTFSYAQVEAALAKTYESEDVQRRAFRGRLKHFRKLGIPQQQPGKGSRIRYTASDIFQLMVACEFSEFGVDPHLIAAIVRRHWLRKDGFFQAIDFAQRFPGDDFLVVIHAYFMSWKWTHWTRGVKIKQTATEISISSVSEPVSIRFLKVSDSAIFLQELQKAGQRFFVFNLSARVRAVEQALTTSNSAALETHEK